MSKAAIWGAALFIGISLMVVFGNLFFDYDLEDESNIFLNVIIIITTIPFLAITRSVGIADGGIADSLAYSLYVIINGLLGAFVFATVAAFWQFFTKVEPENKNEITA